MLSPVVERLAATGHWTVEFPPKWLPMRPEVDCIIGTIVSRLYDKCAIPALRNTGVLNQIAHARNAYWLVTRKGFAIGSADRPTPKRGLIAEPIQKRGRIGGPAGDELAAIALDGGELCGPVPADVQYEGRLFHDPQMHAVIIEHTRGMVRFAGQIGLGELRPKAGGLNQLDRRGVVGMSIDPIGCEQ